MRKIVTIVLIVFTSLGYSQTTEIDSLSKLIDKKDFIIDSLKRELFVLNEESPGKQKLNYCFVRFDRAFFVQNGFAQKLVSSFEFTINSRGFPVAYDTIFIPINPTGLDTLTFKSSKGNHQTLLKLKPKELYTIYFNECIGTYLIRASRNYGSASMPGVTGLFNGDFSKGNITIGLHSHTQDTTYNLKNSNTFSAKLSPLYDMCGNIPQRIEIANPELNKIFASFYFTFIHNEKLRVMYYEKKSRLIITVEQ